MVGCPWREDRRRPWDLSRTIKITQKRLVALFEMRDCHVTTDVGIWGPYCVDPCRGAWFGTFTSEVRCHLYFSTDFRPSRDLPLRRGGVVLVPKGDRLLYEVHVTVGHVRPPRGWPSPHHPDSSVGIVEGVRTDSLGVYTLKRYKYYTY